MREPALLLRRPATAALPRPALSGREHPGGGVTALLAAVVLALVAGVPLRSAHLLLPDPED
ncbi:hypothetical protein [Methylobacterium aerolatum]|uniref:Uncharacterized protein n=1 Tax=Methylobacterium aerolatum TaxID=418708 RepID=A0ABU0HUV5_9HYPH|nr:hypothetical protein [Methylobacterium aerolatum]MDQ0446071.1 hypothetical protein [Methylobacterium aerolatum]GJD35107.1 hypothetical protein FMGBMHLM_2015 [Methylobacterium aerolatum]